MSDYVPDFHIEKTLFQIGVKAIIRHTDTDKILILTRSESVSSKGTADLPGGNLENFESPLEGMVREIMEETELACFNFKLINVHTIHHQDQPLLIIGYYCETNEKNVVINWESTRYSWVSIDEALKMDLPYSHLEIIQNIPA